MTQQTLGPANQNGAGQVGNQPGQPAIGGMRVQQPLRPGAVLGANNANRFPGRSLELRRTSSARSTDDIDGNFYKYAKVYCDQMENKGYSKGYTDLVHKSMSALHEKGIERHIPLTLKSFDSSVHVQGRNMRANLENAFAKAVEEMGGDYNLAKDYFVNQKKNSWSNRALAFKGFSLMQRGDIAGDEARYFLRGHTAEDLIGIYDDQLRSLAEEELRRENRPQTPENMAQKTQEVSNRYEKTMAACQALTAISLSRIKNIPGLNLAGNDPSLTLLRGTTFFKYGGPQGIADSASLVRPHLHYIKAAGDKTDANGQVSCKKGNVDGYILTMKVPVCDVKFPYFLFPGICSDQVTISNPQIRNLQYLRELPGENHDEQDRFIEEQDKISQKKAQDIEDREMVCDLSHADVIFCEEIRNGGTIAITDNDGNPLNRDAGEALGGKFYGEELYGG